MTAERTVHLLVGLPGSGKSTLARAIEHEQSAVRFTLDEWMLRLHDRRFDDPAYGELASRCQELIWDVAQQVLRAGVDVILDWSMWSRDRRRRWTLRAKSFGARVVVHHLTTSAEVAVERAASREDPYAHRLSADDVKHMIALLEPPDASEGFELVTH